jgi:5'-deoxynucleotidase YfbR-like HD superfamily hydrolase
MEKIFEENQSGSTLRDLEGKWKKSTTAINKAIKKYEEYLAQTNSTKSNSEKPLDDYADYEEVE